MKKETKPEIPCIYKRAHLILTYYQRKNIAIVSKYIPFPSVRMSLEKAFCLWGTLLELRALASNSTALQRKSSSYLPQSSENDFSLL